MGLSPEDIRDILRWKRLSKVGTGGRGKAARKDRENIRFHSRVVLNTLLSQYLLKPLFRLFLTTASAVTPFTGQSQTERQRFTANLIYKTPVGNASAALASI